MGECKGDGCEGEASNTGTVGDSGGVKLLGN